MRTDQQTKTLPQAVGLGKAVLRQIPGFPDYFASDDGEVYSYNTFNKFSKRPPTPKKLKKCFYGKKNRNYYRVSLCKDGEKVTKKVAHIMLTTFISSRPKGMVASHGAKGSLVDSLDNLSWQTQKQNCADKYRDGTEQRGEKHSQAKLNELQVRVIRRAYEIGGKFGVSRQGLADMFGVKKTAIRCIITRKTWSHIQ